MKQKTIRFYDKSKDDMDAYAKLDRFRDYGFISAREMMIAAVNYYTQKDENSIGMDIEKLAELVASKISANVIDGTRRETVENKLTCNEECNNAMNKALSFIESL